MKLGELEVTHQEAIRTSGNALRETTSRYENEMDVTASRVKEEHTNLREQLGQALENDQNTKMAHDETRRELELLRAAVPDLETKVP